MLEVYIRDRETLELFLSGLKEAGLMVYKRRFYGFRLRPESGVVEVTQKNVSAIVRTIALQCAKNPESHILFREQFVNNTADWVVGPIKK